MKFLKDWAPIVAVIIAIIAGAVKFGKLEERVSTEEFDKKKRELIELIDTEKNDILKDSLSALPVGTIVASVLKPEDFISSSMQGIWLPADGRDTPKGSNFPQKVLPDLRGMFLRGWNEFNNFKGPRDGDFADLGKRNKLGYQKDTTKLPNTPFKTDIEPAKTLSHSVAYTHPQGGAFAKGGQPPYFTITTTVPKHDHTVISGGDVETRPKNIAVYFYIKIK